MSTETIALGLPPVPRERRSRADIEAAAPLPVVTAPASTAP